MSYETSDEACYTPYDHDPWDFFQINFSRKLVNVLIYDDPVLILRLHHHQHSRLLSGDGGIHRGILNLKLLLLLRAHLVLGESIFAVEFPEHAPAQLKGWKVGGRLVPHDGVGRLHVPKKFAESTKM